MTKEANIYTVLAEAQLEFGTVTKGSTNPAFKSKYADLADVASVVIPTLAGKGVCVLHYVVGDEAKAMRTEFVHGATQSKVYCDVPLIVNKNDMQGMKSATTYAKRIGLESLSGIAPEDDDGNDAAKAPPARREPPALIDGNQHKHLLQLFEEKGRDIAKFCEWAKIPDVTQLPASRYEEACRALMKPKG